MPDELPTYLNHLLIRNCDIHKRSARYRRSNFVCPRIKHETKGAPTFTVTNIRAWNSTPFAIRQYGSKKSFKNALIIAQDYQLILDHF